jgi:hypothetical protein
VGAIPSLIIENQKAPLSYAFRRQKIFDLSGVNLDDFTSPVEKAARAFAHWYLLALKRQPRGVLRVENFLHDCQVNIRGHEFHALDVSFAETGADKPYPNVRHDPKALGCDWMNDMSSETLALLRDVAGTLGYCI